MYPLDFMQIILQFIIIYLFIYYSFLTSLKINN